MNYPKIDTIWKLKVKDCAHTPIQNDRPNSPPPGSMPPEMPTSGSGAFAGLVVGALAGGVLAGPIGTIVCGILGTVIGDQVEREKRRMEKNK